MKRIIAVALLALLVALPVSARQERRGGDGAPGFQFFKTHAAELGIPAEKIAQLETMHFEHKKKMIELHAAEKTAELEFQHLMAADTPDRGAIVKALDRLSKARAELEKARVMHRLDVHELLGREVCERAMQMRQTMHKERCDMPGMMGHGMGMGPGGMGCPNPQCPMHGGMGPGMTPAPPAPGPGM